MYPHVHACCTVANHAAMVVDDALLCRLFRIAMHSTCFTELQTTVVFASYKKTGLAVRADFRRYLNLHTKNGALLPADSRGGA